MPNIPHPYRDRADTEVPVAGVPAIYRRDVRGSMTTTWVAAGEAKGLLTMPPDRERIWVGPVAIQLGDDGRASATGYEIVMDPVGMTSSNRHVGPTRVCLGCEVEAESARKAHAAAYLVMENALDLVALASGAAVGPVRECGCSRR
ncbi:MAG: hypothetical protein WKH64_18640 [Chloroflexia bacterium]